MTTNIMDQQGVISRSSNVGTWGKERRVHGREGERRAWEEEGARGRGDALAGS